MNFTRKTCRPINNATCVGSFVGRILLCCFVFGGCSLVSEIALAQAPGLLFAKQDFAKQDMTDRVELAPGFRLLKLAGNEQIPNAFCMAVHDSGDLVVSGPGYLRRLKVSDKGLEKVADLPHAPAGGAQGLWCEASDLYFVGGEGLCRIKGALGDLSNEALAKLAEPEVLLKIDVGKEHQAHAIRKGPEQWWYLICGNDTKLDPKFWSHKDSPVVNPEAGCLLRLDFELKEYQVFAEGFRNAYDFDFGADGSVYVYDSDGERDVSLPWYRPTRVFRVAAGDHAGWVNKSWKRPSYYPDMPTEVAALGRGSPTGVCYNGQNEMGKQFAHWLFVGDWTFGRIAAIDVANDDESPVDFLLSKGQFGFAVTDLVIGTDGLLYVAVGGRGTEGGLFRIEPIDPVTEDGVLDSNELAGTKDEGQCKKDQSERNFIDDIRARQLELGGCGGCDGMMAGYTAKRPLQNANSELAPLLQKYLNALFSQEVGEREIDELLRLCAMERFQSDDLGGTVSKILDSEKDPVRRIHLLNCYSFIVNSPSTEQAQKISQFLLGLKPTLAQQGKNTDRNWEPRMKELVAALAKHPRIGRAIVDSPLMGPVHTLYVAEALTKGPAEHVNDSVKTELANVILAWCRKNSEQVSARHVKLFQRLPKAASFLRSIVDERPHLLSPTVDVLVDGPTAVDRATFVRGLRADRLQTQKNSAIGLRRLMDKGAELLSFEETQVAVGVLTRLGSDGPSNSVRKQLMLMLKSSFVEEDDFVDGDLAQTVQYLEKRFGKAFKLEVDGTVDVDQWLAKFDWNNGDVARGKGVFTKVQCAGCHQSGSGQLTGSALGPSLEGITKRFSKRALFQSILNPDRDVADRYRAVLVETEDGEFVAGLKVYQSADGITLLLADGSTARINTDQIAELKQSKRSLMPARLLDNLTPLEIADLWAFLATL